MKLRWAVLSLMAVIAWCVSAPLWAESDRSTEPRKEQQYRSMTEELMSMLKETLSIIRNLDHAPSAEEKRQLTAMMDRLDAMLRQQQQTMEQMRDQLDSIRQQQDEFMQRQRILEQQQRDIPLP